MLPKASVDLDSRLLLELEGLELSVFPECCLRLDSQAPEFVNLDVTMEARERERERERERRGRGVEEGTYTHILESRMQGFDVTL